MPAIQTDDLSAERDWQAAFQRNTTSMIPSHHVIFNIGGNV